MQSLVGLNDQRTWRDLRLLPQDAVRWVGADELADAPEPAVLCGVWAAEAAEAADVLRRRQSAGATSVLVPRFGSGALGPVLGMPVAVEVVPKETQSVTWRDGTVFAVPSTTALRTSLPDGRWASSDSLATVVAWRPHTQAGWTVLCTPTIAGRALGADPVDQLALLVRILDETARTTEARRSNSEPATEPAASTEEFLARHGELGALALLALLATPGRELDGAALARLGVEIDSDTLQRLSATLPPLDRGDVETSLRSAGWGSHMRLLGRRSMEDA